MKNQPNPTSLIDSMNYIFEQAEMGRFAKKTSALTVLIYLMNGAWRKPKNKEGAPIGVVMVGKSRLSKIAASTGMSENTARTALDWLVGNGWVRRKEMFSKDGRQDWNQYQVLLDQSSHDSREEQREREELVRGVQNLEGGSPKSVPYEGQKSGPPNKGYTRDLSQAGADDQ